MRLAINALGSGHGGMADDKGTIHEALIAAAMKVVSQGIDVVIVTHGATPYSAAQRARRRWLRANGVADAEHWPCDGSRAADLDQAAADLVTHASSGDLVLFLGAGVSAGAGLPVWQSLLDTLWDGHEDAVDVVARRGLDVRDQAMLLAKRLAYASPDSARSLSDELQARLGKDRYSLAHGLLASLGIRESVTTNFDCLYESAVRASAAQNVAVLPYEPVRPNQPWLLKLHGSVDREGIVLTRDDYLGAADTHGALFGIVQAMLMTKHMIFVGYSLSDEDFHRLVFEVRAALKLATGSKQKLGTVLTLFEDPLRAELWRDEFTVVSMTGQLKGTDVEKSAAFAHAARQLDIFLDLLAYHSSSVERFLLDSTYDSMLTRDERKLRDLLKALLDDRALLAQTGVGQELLSILRRCGLRDEPVDPPPHVSETRNNMERQDPAQECEHGDLRAACIECLEGPQARPARQSTPQARLSPGTGADGAETPWPLSRPLAKGERALTFDFPVNHSFLRQGDHPITFRKNSYNRLAQAIGHLDHSSRPVDVVNIHGQLMDGRVRHSVSGGGGEYYQLNCHDPQIIDGLSIGDVIQVDLIATAHRPEIRLSRR